MIKIRNTNNLVGITILGDYEDLSALRDALYYYTELFLSNQDHPDAYDCQQSILGLCYDIRHAYQGDRDFEAVPNNAENIAILAECIYEIDPVSKESIESSRKTFGHGNLYFSVDILYPWAIYYLYVLQAITDIPCDQSWFEKLDYPYDEYQAEHDMALIQYSVQLLWGCVKTVLPPRVFKALWDYTRTFSHTDYYISCPDLYLQWLSHYWASKKQSRETRVSLLPMLFLELSSIDPEDEDSLLEESSEKDDRFNEFVRSINQTALQCMNLYDNYYDLMQSVSTLPFYSTDEFYSIISEYVEEHGPFTEESFDEYLDDTLGSVDWDRVEW